MLVFKLHENDKLYLQWVVEPVEVQTLNRAVDAKTKKFLEIISEATLSHYDNNFALFFAYVYTTQVQLHTIAELPPHYCIHQVPSTA